MVEMTKQLLGYLVVLAAMGVKVSWPNETGVIQCSYAYQLVTVDFAL